MRDNYTRSTNITLFVMRYMFQYKMFKTKAKTEDTTFEAKARAKDNNILTYVIRNTARPPRSSNLRRLITFLHTTETGELNA